MQDVLELVNDDCAAVIDCAHGGRMASLRVFGEELLVGRRDDVLGWGCYPLAPWAGRLRDRRFAFGGHCYWMPANFGTDAIHGTVFGRAWEVVAEHAIATELGEDWPFPGRATQGFALGPDALEMRLRIEALDEPFPASAGFHPWFRRRLASGTQAELGFHAAERLLLDANGIPTGERGPMGEGPWDDCFVGVAPDPLIRWPGVLALTLSSSHRHWVVFDEPAHALCVEPWTAPPDALNGGCAIVAPGAALELVMTLRWQRDDSRAAARQRAASTVTKTVV